MGQWRAVDADGHVREEHIDWAARLAPEYRDRAPKMHPDEHGLTNWIIDDLRFPSPAYEGKGRWVSNDVPIGANPKGMTDPLARLPDMDTEDIDIAVLYGTSIAFHCNSTDDWRYSLAIEQAWNDWAAEYCSADPARLKFAALVPVGEPGAAAEEAERAVRERGATGITVLPNYRGRALDSSYFDPLYAACERLGVPLCVHGITGSRHWVQTIGAHENWLITHALAFPMGLIHGLASVVCGGVLERYPSLRVAFLEGGCGWLPFFMDRLDEHVEKLPSLAPALTKLPSEYIKGGRLFVSCEPEEDLAYPIERLGEDVLMYASDYAHWDCEFPNSVRKIGEREELTDTQKAKILRENALRCYGLRVPATV
jgi:uncharacterized protein